METESIVRSPKQNSESDERIEIEFDGNTVLCRVCGDRASGFHYGVHACEGCKGFFRRSIQQKIQYRPCLKNQLCLITRVNRNRCQYCRLKKCIAVGMSRDAVRFGRVPKREKAKIMEQMQKVNIQCHGSMLEAILANEAELRRQIVEAHLKTCEFTRADFEQFYKKAWSQPEIVNCPSHMACPLNPFPDAQFDTHKWDRFTDCFMPAIRNVVSFAKCIPGFSVLSQEDQVTLLKAGTFEVLLVHLACLFDSKSNTMIFMNGRIFRRTSLSFSTGAGYLLDSVFDFSERFNELNLTDDEIALFSALVIISSDRPGLRGADLVEKLQASIARSLQMQMKANHHGDQSVFAKLLVKVSELRMLNTVHSEKLLGLSVPSAESPPEVFPVGGVCSESRSMNFYHGSGGCRDLDKKPVDVPFNFKSSAKSKDCGMRPEVIDLRSETNSLVSGSTRWPSGPTPSGHTPSGPLHAGENVDRSRYGVYKPRAAFDERVMRGSLPSKSGGDSFWVPNEVTNSAHSATTRNHNAALSSTNSSLTAHLSGSSIVARQVMMKTVQQELILSTPVGTFHRMPLNLWTSAAAAIPPSSESQVQMRAQKEEISQMEVEDGNSYDHHPPLQQLWKIVDDAKDSLALDKSVITRKNKVMRTWSEDTSSSKLSCSSCCSDSNINVDAFPLRSTRATREQLEEPATRSSPQFQNITREKVSECSSTFDLPVQKTSHSAGSLYASDSYMHKLRISNILGHSIVNDIGDIGLQKHCFNPRDQPSRQSETGVHGASYQNSGPWTSAELFRNAFHSSVKIPVKESSVETDRDVLPWSSRPSSLFTAENILRLHDHSTRNKLQKTDQEMRLNTKATLKERLIRRIDSKDNINAVDSIGKGNGSNSGNGGRMLQGALGADSTIPTMDMVNPAFPLQFLNDYPHFYPLGVPAGGIHPGILYNHLALQQHLHNIQQQQQLQVQVQLNQALQHSRIPKTADTSMTSNSTESSLVQSNSSEHLHLDGSSEREDIKHLKAAAAECLSHQSSFLLKSETA